MDTEFALFFCRRPGAKDASRGEDEADGKAAAEAAAS